MNREQRLEEALEWAISEIDGQTRYVTEEQFDNAMKQARAALSAPKAEDLDLGMERVGKSLEAGVTPEVDRLARAVAPIAWLRDLDGTGSLHVCAKGDPDAIAVYTSPVPALTDEAVEQALAEWSKPNDKREPVEIMRAALLAAIRVLGGK